MKNFRTWSQCVSLFTFGLALLSLRHAQGQTPPLLWQTNIGATSVIAVDEFTNVYASSNGTVIKLSSAGLPLQTNILSDVRGRAMRDAAGNFYYAGIRPGFDSGGILQYGTTNACYLAKFTSAGSLVWSNGFGPVGSIRQTTIDDVKVDADGNVYVGFTWYISTTSHSSEVAKFDTTGSNIWKTAMPRFGYSTTVGAVRFGNVSSTNGYAITYDDKFSFTWAVILSRFDSNGTPTVITNWDESQDITPPLIQNTADNFYDVEGGGVTKRTPTGAVLWQNPMVPASWPVGGDSYDGVHVASSSGALSRVDSDGNLAWTTNFPGHFCQQILIDASGNRFLSFSDRAVGRLGPETLSAPAITNQPRSQTTFVGSNVVISVGASGFTPLRYYWFFNNSLLSLQSNASLTLPNVTTNQAGSYYVIVSNIVNTVTSAPAQLRVKQVALYIGNQQLTNGTYTFATNPTVTVRSAFASGSSFYTLNGSAPTFLSTPYSAPFSLFTNATVRAIGYSSDFSLSEEADAIDAIVLAHHSLSASTAGGGSIQLSPPGGDYLSSDIVTVTAVPDSGWTFLYWTGDASGSSNPISSPMHSDKTIHAVFGTTLATTVQGNGQVLLYPSSGPYSYGQTVRLTAVPGSGSYFGVWGNAASGSANPLYFTVTNATPTVSSIFGVTGPNQATLTVNISGRGNVAASPQANVYTTGQSVALTATPDLGQTFVNWTGDATGTQNPLNITLNQSQVITAHFTGGPILRISPELGEGLHSDGFRFSLLGDPNAVYEIWYSSNLLSWNSLGLVTNTSPETSWLDTNAVNFPKGYYQIKP